MNSLSVNKILFTVFFLNFIYNASAGSEITLPILSENDLPNWKITKTKFYNQKELYGYIDGGAEIYLEYGFKRLAVQELKNSLSELKIEIFQMSDAAAAFGIFSISRNECSVVKDLPEFHCSTPYQLLIARGPFYMTFTNFTGDPDSQKRSAAIAGKILKKIDLPEFSVPDAFRHAFFSSFRKSLKLVRGPLGLQNSLSTWTDLFEGFTGYSLFIVPVTEGDKQAKTARILFKSEKDVQLFFNRIRLDDYRKNRNQWRMRLDPDLWRTARWRGNRVVLFVEADSGVNNFEKILKAMVPEEW